MSATPATVREYTGLPDQVPDPLLTRHLGVATRRVLAELGLEVAPQGSQDFTDLICLYAYISALPYLNTFALDGSSQVARLVQSEVDVRFLSAEDVQDLIDLLEAQAGKLLARLRKQHPGDDPDDVLTIGSLRMAAV